MSLIISEAGDKNANELVNRELKYHIELNREMHRNAGVFLGYSTQRHVDEIASLIERTGAETLLDYGSGKGMQYLGQRAHERWGGILPWCYDPGVRGIHKLPSMGFDGVLCIDTLEHIPEAGICLALRDIFKRAHKFVFLSIGMVPAGKLLPDGRNCHVTLRPEAWWEEQISKFHRREQESVSSRFTERDPDIVVKYMYDDKPEDEGA